MHVIRFKIALELTRDTVDLRHFPRVVRQMIKRKGGNDQAAEDHRARSEFRHKIITPMLVHRLHGTLIRHRACLAVFRGKLERRPNVQPGHRQQPKPRHPQQRPKVVQLFSVLIERRRPGEHQQVAEQMRNDETKQARARDGHEVLTPQ